MSEKQNQPAYPKTVCGNAFLSRIAEIFSGIDMSTISAAINIRDFIVDNPTIPIMQVYAELAEYSIRGRSARAVRDWIEAIAGLPDEKLLAWHAAGLSMGHFKMARKLYKDMDGELDENENPILPSPAAALDNAVKHGGDNGNRPMTIAEMVSFYEGEETIAQRVWREFRVKLEKALEIKAPIHWSDDKLKRYKSWLASGAEFLEK